MHNKGIANNLLLKIIAYSVLFFSKIVFWKKKQRTWLVACGGDRWGDNADAFWHFMNKNYPEIKTLAVVKNKKAINASLKNWIKRNRLSTFIQIMQAEVLATTHTLSDIGPESLTSLAKAKKIWLQHGVIAIGKITAKKAKAEEYDLICASSSMEKHIMTDVIGIKPELLAITGLARHDRLKNRVNKGLKREGILYIPTSRSWFNASQKKYYENLLFRWVINLLQKEEKKEIKIWLHPGWYKHDLEIQGLSYGNVRSFGLEADPQELICESKLLITDYSSVFFDAALSGIPTIFYQPDRSYYIERKGLLRDFLEQDLLLVVDNQSDLLLQIDKILSNSDYYERRLKKDQEWAFKYVETFDGHSCQRIFQQIANIL